MFILRVPERYQEVYNNFKKGKYSHFPENYKAMIFKYHGIADVEHKVAKVLFKHVDLREELEDRLDTILPEGSEVSSVPDMSIEIYAESMKVKDPLEPNLKPFE